MKTTASTLLLALATAIPLAAAHGILQDMTIDGKFIKGNRVGGPTEPSGIRQVFSQDPIKGANNRDTNCGAGAQPAALVLDAMPGSKLTFNWRTASGGQWPHNTGPMFTYLASCGSTTCDKFDAINAKWFKIQQSGRRQDGTWEQQEIMNGGVARASLPSNLAPGNYLVRHEILALHLATNPGGAEFYAGCAQLRVGGSETGVPPQQALVSIPGVVKDNDPGVFDPNVFNTQSNYVFPGPPVATLVSGGSNTGSPSPPPPEQSGSCQLKAQPRKAKRNGVEDGNYRPRQMSRVMRNLRIH
jgi:hypothetical protein